MNRTKPTFVKIDGGRTAAGFGKEKMDCTVVAYATALEIPYIEAYEHLKACGRKKNKGFFWHEAVSGDDRFLYNDNYNVRKKYPTVHQFVKHNTIGTYVLKIAGHVLTLKDGIVYDTMRTKFKARLYSVTEV